MPHMPLHAHQPPRRDPAPTPAPVPPAPPPQPSPPKDEAKTYRVGLGTLSPKSYEPDFDRMCRTLTGKDPHRDEDTGIMVLRDAPERSAAARPQQAQKPKVP